MGMQRCAAEEYNISFDKPDIAVVNSRVKIDIVNVIELNSNARM